MPKARRRKQLKKPISMTTSATMSGFPWVKTETYVLLQESTDFYIVKDKDGSTKAIPKDQCVIHAIAHTPLR